MSEPDRLPRHGKGPAGFTLLEMLLVLTLAAALTSAAATVLRPRPLSLEQTTDQVARLLRGARQAALVSGRDVAVTIDAAGGRIARDGAAPVVLHPPIRVERAASVEPADAAARGGQDVPEVTFFGTGGATGITLSLIRGTERRDLEIRWLTGAVRRLDVTR